MYVYTMDAKIAFLCLTALANVCYLSDFMIYINLFSPPTFHYCTRNRVAGVCHAECSAQLLLSDFPIGVYEATECRFHQTSSQLKATSHPLTHHYLGMECKKYKLALNISYVP